MTTTNETPKVNICLDDLHYLFSDDYPGSNKTATRFKGNPTYARLCITARNDFAKAILPEDIYLVLESARSADAVISYGEEKKKAELSSGDRARRTTLNRVFKNEGIGGAKERFQQVANLLLRQRVGIKYGNYNTSPYRKEIAGRWGNLLIQLTEEETEHLKSRTYELIYNLPESPSDLIQIKRRLLQDNIELNDLLSSLTLIACTLHIWNQESIDGDDLVVCYMILAPLPDEPEENLPSKKLLKDNAEKARQMLKRIEPKISYAETIKSSAEACHVVCHEILGISPLDDAEVLGQTYFVLYQCLKNKTFFPPDRANSDYYLRQSQKYQWQEALAIAPEEVSRNLYDTIPQGVSSKQGLCITNADKFLLSDVSGSMYYKETNCEKVHFDNTRLQCIYDSTPEGWSWGSFHGKFPTDATLPVKYFLFHECFEKNYDALLSILNYYKINWNDAKPSDIEIYMLGNGEQIGNLVDTAQQYMADHIIPVHIINEEKRSAQFLLARHPLFYPVRDFPAEECTPQPPKPNKQRKSAREYSIFNNSKNNKQNGADGKKYNEGNPDAATPSKTLHFVILGTDKCAEYLVREASWMMTLPKTIIPKITVVGKNAKATVDSILSRCPGLKDTPAKGKGYKTIGEHFPSPYASTSSICDIEPINVSDFYSLEFDEYLYRLLSSNDALYFVVSNENSIESLEEAVSLREKMVRFYIARQFDKNMKLLDMPPIAFRCTDFHVASMAKHLVVSKVNHGNSWFNDHAIIPFGTYSDLYGWNGLVDNPIEYLAQSVHLVYSKCYVPDNHDALSSEYKQKIRQELANYYKRQYNKDSSFSVALSFPYRLFNCIHKDHRILLSGSWDFANPDSYFDYQTLRSLADEVAYLTKSEANEKTKSDVEATAEWEHERWIRWMLSEGWLPAFIDHVGYYQAFDVKDNQLYIGKLHPALCLWKDLEILKENLEPDSEGNPYDYKIYDLDSAKLTASILRGAIALHEAEIVEKEHGIDASL